MVRCSVRDQGALVTLIGLAVGVKNDRPNWWGGQGVFVMRSIRVGFAADFYERDGFRETQFMRNVQWRMIDGAGALLSCDSAISTSLDTSKGRIWCRVAAQCNQSSYQGTNSVLMLV